MLSGCETVESCLPSRLVEHLNAEIVLGSVTDICLAMNWLRSTFFYVRATSDPQKYNIPAGLSKEEIETRLQGTAVHIDPKEGMNVKFQSFFHS